MKNLFVILKGQAVFQLQVSQADAEALHKDFIEFRVGFRTITGIKPQNPTPVHVNLTFRLEDVLALEVSL